MEANSSVWVRDNNSDQAWVLGTIFQRKQKGDGVDIIVELDYSGERVTFSCDHEDTELDDVKLANDPKMALSEDMINLPFLHEPAILHSLSERYEEGEIYTFTGPILLAVNPFKDLPLYTNEILEEYYTNGMLRGQGLEVVSEAPHVYSIADAAYREMMKTIMNISGAPRRVPKQKEGSFGGDGSQSILISGESGAGKTESTKIVMRYLTAVGNPEGITAVAAGSIMDKVLQSNPILEAFGNARTIRNDNSSRFGKFIELRFDRRGHLLGAALRTYLLEKVRLPSQGPGERSFHIFYQLCKGLMAGRVDPKYGLSGCEEYAYLNGGGCFDLTHVDDLDELAATLHGMRVMGFTEAEVDAVLSVTAGVLHLGQLRFESVHTGEGEGSKVAEAPEVGAALAKARELCALDPARLEAALTTNSVSIRGETFLMRLRPEQAADARDALAKHLYGHMFAWLVAKINGALKGEATAKTRASISVLDIFGFECFDRNSFEQLCINYTNEALQQQFNQFVFKLEQKEYDREGIEWSFIEFPDNQDCLDLIEGKPQGLIAMLDDECRLPKGQDSKYAGRLYQALEGKHPRFEVSKKDKVDFKFGVRHYAGLVTYETDGFLLKNKDDLPKEAEALFQASTSEFVRGLFELDEGAAAQRGSPAAAAASGRKKRPGAGGAKVGTVDKPSIGTQFKGQLRALMADVQETRPHYIRCLKPNDILAPDQFVRTRVIEQLRYGGVLEAVRVARSGYPVRLAHAEFFARYRGLAPPPRANNGGGGGGEAATGPGAPGGPGGAPLSIKGLSPEDARPTCAELVARIVGPPPPERELYGRLADAYRAGAGGADGGGGGAEFTPLHRRPIEPISVQLGATKVFLRKESHDLLEARRTRRLTLAAVVCQAAARGGARRRAYQRWRRAALRLQTQVRRLLGRREGRRRREARAAGRLQTRLRGHAARARYRRFRAATCALQAAFLGRRARRAAAAAKHEGGALRVQTWYRGARARRRALRARARVVALQCRWRCKLARRRARALRAEARSVSKLQQSNEQMKSEIQRLQQEALKATNLRTTAEVERLAARAAELEGALAAERAARAAAEGEARGLRRRVDGLLGDLERAVADHQKLRAAHQEESARMQSEFEEQLMQAKLEASQSRSMTSQEAAKLAKALGEMAELNTQLDKLKADEARTLKAMEQQAEESRALELRLKEADARGESLQSRVSEELERAALAKAATEEANAQLARARAELESARGAQAGLEAELERHAGKDEALARQGAELAAAAAALGQARGEAEALRRRAAEGAAEAEGLRARAERAEAEAGDLARRLGQAESEIEQHVGKDEIMKRKDDEAAGLRGDLAAARSVADALQAQLVEASSAAEDLEARLGRAGEELAAKATEARALGEALAAAERRLEGAGRQARELEEARAALGAERGDADKWLHRATEAEARLARREAELRASADGLRREAALHRKHNEKLAGDARAAQRDRDELQSQLISSRDTVRKLQFELETKDTDNQKLMRKLEEAVTTSSGPKVRGALAEVQAQLEGERAQRKAAEAEARRAGEERHRLDHQVKGLTAELVSAAEAGRGLGPGEVTLPALLEEERARARALELRLKEAEAQLAQRKKVSVLEKYRAAGAAGDPAGLHRQHQRAPSGQVVPEGALAGQPLGIAARFRQMAAEKHGLVPRGGGGGGEVAGSPGQAAAPLAPGTPATPGAAGTPAGDAAGATSPEKGENQLGRPSAAVSRFEQQLDAFKSELLDGIECCVWEARVQEAPVRMRLEAEGQVYHLRWDHAEGGGVLGGFLGVFSKKGQAVERLQLFELLEVRHGHSGIARLERADTSKFLNMVTLATPSTPERHIVVRVESRERRNTVVWGLRKLLAEMQMRLRANLGPEGGEAAPATPGAAPAAPAPAAAAAASHARRGSFSRLENDPNSPTSKSSDVFLDAAEHQSAGEGPPPPPSAAAAAAPPTAPRSPSSGGAAPSAAEAAEHVREVQELIRQVELERANYERVMVQLLEMTNDLNQREDQLQAARRQTEQLRQECAKLERKNAEYSRTRLEIIKRLENVQFDREDLREQNENLKEEVAELRRIQKDVQAQLALRMV